MHRRSRNHIGQRKTATPELPQDRWLVLGVYVFLIAITWIVFGQTLHFDFINFDDGDYVYKNQEVTRGLTFAGIVWAFTHLHAANWHPVTWISHMLDCQLYGLRAAGHHMTNVVIHTATVVFLFRVLRRMTGALWLSAFVAAVGTGGTLAGVTTYLKEQNPKIEIVCADPYGAAMWSWFTNGNLETNDGDSIAEGIGQGRVTKNIEGVKVDRAYRIPDQTGLTIVYQLLREEGLFLGLSSGINVAGAVRFAKESGPGQTIVTILCDSGHKYQSTLFNRDWLASNHLDPELPLESIIDR
jgi:hypothetical protein